MSFITELLINPIKVKSEGGIFSNPNKAITEMLAGTYVLSEEAQAIVDSAVEVEPVQEVEVEEPKTVEETKAKEEAKVVELSKVKSDKNNKKSEELLCTAQAYYAEVMGDEKALLFADNAKISKFMYNLSEDNVEDALVKLLVYKLESNNKINLIKNLKGSVREQILNTVLDMVIEKLTEIPETMFATLDTIEGAKDKVNQLKVDILNIVKDARIVMYNDMIKEQGQDLFTGLKEIVDNFDAFIEEMLKEITTSMGVTSLEQMAEDIKKAVSEMHEEVAKTTLTPEEKKAELEDIMTDNTGEVIAEANKHSANFMHNPVTKEQIQAAENNVIDITNAIPVIPEQEIKKNEMIQEGLAKIDSFAKYYNRDRISVMLGANIGKIDDAMTYVSKFVDVMTQEVNSITGVEDMDVVKSKLVLHQHEMVNIINGFNPHFAKTNDISGLKTLEVDGTGTPLVYEDVFGDSVTSEEVGRAQVVKFYTPDSSLPFDNSMIYQAHPAIGRIANAIESMGYNISLDIQEIRGIYKVTPYAQERPLNTGFYLDVNGIVLNSVPKIILPCEGTLEDGYMFNIENIELLMKYISNHDISQDLVLTNIVDDTTRELNKVVDLSSIAPNYRDEVKATIMTADNLLTDAVNNDINCRFQLSQFTDSKNFQLVSNTKVKKSFLENGIRRTKQTMTFVNGKAELDSAKK